MPEGYYLLEAVKVVPTDESTDKTTGMHFHYTIREGAAGIGREITMFNGMSTGMRDGRGTQFGFGRTMGALGQAEVAKTLASGKVAIDTWAKLDGLCKQLTPRIAGKKCVALITDQSVNNRAISSITEVLGPDEWMSLKGLSITSAVRPQAAAPAGTPPNGASPVADATLGAELEALFNLPA